MTDPAAILAQLVDVRNVGMHKYVKLTLHCPTEQANEILAAFGWPTASNPVPVALARLDVAKMEVEHKAPALSPDAPKTRAHKSWHEMKPSEQAGILCGDPHFEQFCRDCYPRLADEKLTGEDFCRSTVYKFCNVLTRADIQPSNAAGVSWRALVAEYREWTHMAEFAGIESLSFE